MTNREHELREGRDKRVNDAGARIMRGLDEALAIAKGEQPAAGIRYNGHDYVPKAEADALSARIALLEAELEGAKKGLRRIAGHDRSYRGRKVSFGIEWAFDAVQAIAKSTLRALSQHDTPVEGEKPQPTATQQGGER